MLRSVTALVSAVVVAASASPCAAQFVKPTAAPDRPSSVTITNEILVFVGTAQSAAGLGRDYGLNYLGSLADAPNILRFRAISPAAAAQLASQLSADARVQQAHVITETGRAGKSFYPDDPFFFPGPNPGVGGTGSSTGNTNFPGQWHLQNQMPNSGTNLNTIDTRVVGAWGRNLTGNGVVIGIIDDAVQVGHPDLAPNNQAALSFDFFSNDADPNPGVGSTSHHGTAVAGIAAARGGNGIGVTGAAPLAGLAGLRTEYATTPLLNSYTWRNDAIRIKNHSYGEIDPYVNTSALNSVITSTATDPTNPVIHVWAAGNERGDWKQDANTEMTVNNPRVIAVAALGSNGRFASYSCFGATVFVTAPSNSSGGFVGTTTVDRTGSAGYNTNGGGGTNYASPFDYTNDFGGTSSAAPLASGVIALAVEARTNAGFTTDVRVMRHLLALTSRQVDASDATRSSDGGWRTNAAGYRFNQNYGFGLIDADALTAAAVQYSGVTPLVTYTQSTTAVGQGIPDNNATGISRSFTVTGSPGKLEDVQVTLDITHPWRGDLEAYITSPSGYRSRLMMSTNQLPNFGDSGDNINWTFTTNAFWGEQVNGTWTVTVTDLATGDLGTWNSYAVTFHTGELVPVPEPGTVLGIAAGVLGLGGFARRRWWGRAVGARETAPALETSAASTVH